MQYACPVMESKTNCVGPVLDSYYALQKTSSCMENIWALFIYYKYLKNL